MFHFAEYFITMDFSLGNVVIKFSLTTLSILYRPSSWLPKIILRLSYFIINVWDNGLEPFSSVWKTGVLPGKLIPQTKKLSNNHKNVQ